MFTCYWFIWIFLFLLNSVLVSYVFLEIYPFLLGHVIGQPIIIHSTFMNSYICVVLVVMSPFFISFFLKVCQFFLFQNEPLVSLMVCIIFSSPVSISFISVKDPYFLLLANFRFLFLVL